MVTSALILLGLLLLSALAMVFIFKIPVTHTQRILSYEFPESWEHLLLDHFPAYRIMEAGARQKFKKCLKKALYYVQVQPIGDLEISQTTRLLALAPWCALNLRPARLKLKRIILLAPAEVEHYHPICGEHDLVLVWSQEKMLVYPDPHLSEKSLLERKLKEALSGRFKHSSWEELCYGNHQMSEPEILSLLGWT